MMSIVSLAVTTAKIDRQSVVQRHVIRLHGIGESTKAAPPMEEKVVGDIGSCNPSGTWYSDDDTSEHRQIILTPTLRNACPDENATKTSYNATAHNGHGGDNWKDVLVCIYNNNSAWIGRTGQTCDHQTGKFSSTCEQVTWSDPAPHTQKYTWCRNPKDHASCRPPAPAPGRGFPLSLSVGNGAVGFNADATGLQSLNTTYKIFPLSTLTDWGWHSSPYPPDVNPFTTFAYQYFNTSTGRQVPYPMSNSSTPASGYNWLRNNPHRLSMIQVALRRSADPSAPLVAADIANATQTLDPWTGELQSNFTVASAAVRTWTNCHPDVDILGWKVQVPETAVVSRSDKVSGSQNNTIALRIAFPYGSEDPNGDGANWDAENMHTTTIVSSSASSVLFHRKLDFDEFHVACRWTEGAVLTRDPASAHAFVLQLPPLVQPFGDSAAKSMKVASVELSCMVAPFNAVYPISPDAGWLMAKAAATRAYLAAGGSTLPLYDDVASAAAVMWSAFWQRGAFVDLANHTTDTRAYELERRVVLSQFVTRVNSAGATPPQETGYVRNSWTGKFHHEMRWWHQVHFPLWGRGDLLARSDGWFSAMLPNATSYAAFQGYTGARWPKMVGPATSHLVRRSGGPGFDAPSVGVTTYTNASQPLLYWTGPSTTGPMLIWQQPHAIWMAELQRVLAANASAEAAVTERLATIVSATADFMASYATVPPQNTTSPHAREAHPRNGTPEGLWLGPPLKAGEEGNPTTSTFNPTFELTYWRLGLQIAMTWRQRAGLPPKPQWEKVLRDLAVPPTMDTGVPGEGRVYMPNANCYGFPASVTRSNASYPGTHPCVGAFHSHPLFIGALGMINGAAVSPPIDAQIMNTTMRYALNGWDWPGTWVCNSNQLFL
eukprot:m.24554 g.24554  ORF g.24554 m.24554 type:complete len:887 (-) comp13081_c0_seq1:959-3619(-)